MSAIRSLSGEDRTWRRQPNSVENDPTETLALPDDNALDTGFCPINAFTLAANMPSLELGVRHAAPRFHHPSWRRGSRLANGSTDLTGLFAPNWGFARGFVT